MDTGRVGQRLLRETRLLAHRPNAGTKCLQELRAPLSKV